MKDAETALFYCPRYVVTWYTHNITLIRVVERMFNLKKYSLSKKQFIFVMIKAIRQLRQSWPAYVCSDFNVQNLSDLHSVSILLLGNWSHSLVFNVSGFTAQNSKCPSQFLVYLGQGGRYHPARGRIINSLRFSGSPRISKTLLRTHCGHFSIALSSCAGVESRLALLGGAAQLM